MSSSGRALGIGRHSLVPAAVEDSSVTLWRCIDCDGEYHCASEVLEETCAATGD